MRKLHMTSQVRWRWQAVVWRLRTKLWTLKKKNGLWKFRTERSTTRKCKSRLQYLKKKKYPPSSQLPWPNYKETEKKIPVALLLLPNTLEILPVNEMKIPIHHICRFSNLSGGILFKALWLCTSDDDFDLLRQVAVLLCTAIFHLMPENKLTISSSRYHSTIYHIIAPIGIFWWGTDIGLKLCE